MKENGMMKDRTAQTITGQARGAPESSVVVLGMESVGKSSLLSALSGRFAESSALAGTTLRCERYDEGTRCWVDTPGIITGSDAATVRDALTALDSAESVLLVLRADRARDQLDALPPLVGSRKVAVALTFRDRLVEMDAKTEQERLQTWRKRLGVPVVLLDGRKPTALELAGIRTAVEEAAALTDVRTDHLPAFPERQRLTSAVVFERVIGFGPVSLLLLFGPAWVAVTQANALADHYYDSVGALLEGPLAWLNALPALGNLRLPQGKAVLREIVQSLRDFAVMALPIFIGICFLAGLLQWSGALSAWLTRLLAPVMTAFNLPAEAALAVVLGSVRKDGLAIGLLNGEWGSLKVPVDSSVQILTAVYLAGVLLPCLVTVLTVVREMRPGFALKMVGRQAAFAVLFSLLIAWGGALILSLG